MEINYPIPDDTYKPLLIEGIRDIYYISVEHGNVRNSETNHYIIPNYDWSGKVCLPKLEGKYRHFIFRKFN